MISPELYGLPSGLYSMMEKQPQIRLSMQACLKLATSGPSSRDISSALVSIERPCSEYSGNTTRSMVDMFLRAFCTIAQIFLVCAVRSPLVAMVGKLQLNEPDDHAIGRLVPVRSSRTCRGGGSQECAYSIHRAHSSRSACCSSISRACKIYTSPGCDGCLFFQPRHDLDMGGIAELIDRHDRDQTIAAAQ